jgi:PTH1 family peptidyl-tRNA hydrolase
VAGLGNPGLDYTTTRHNTGSRVAQALAEAAGVAFDVEHGARLARARIGGLDVVLIQPQEYMNRSGPPVAAWLAALGLAPDRLLVMVDDLDLDLGRIKIALGGGDGGHRGLRSILDALDGAEFLRVRVGLGRPEGRDPAEYVLSAPAEEEAEVLQAAEARAAQAVEAVLASGPNTAMNVFNLWPWPPREPHPPAAPGRPQGVSATPTEGACERAPV